MALLRRPRPRRTAPFASRRMLDRMKLVLDVSRICAVGDLDSLLQRLAETAASLLRAERADVYLCDPPGEAMWTRRPGGPERRLPSGHALLTAALAGERAVIYEPAVHGPLPHPARQALAAPLRDVDLAPMGVLLVADKARGEFGAEDEVLCELLAEQAAIGIQRFRYQVAAGQAAALHKEMEVARTLQAALIPSRAPRLADMEAVGWTRPASLTGGDGYDIWTLPGERLGVFLGDASGHGLPAALVISQVRTLVRALSEIETEPEWLLARVNERLAQDLPDGRFVTAFVATVGRGGTVRWSSAGQGPVFVCRSPEARYEVLQAQAVPLGVSHDLAAEAAGAVTLEPGGLMVVCSDGVLEAHGAGHEMLGPARLLQALDECRGATAAEVAEVVRRRLDDWQLAPDPMDDQTALVIRRTA